jgi:riboflavin kinase / FMN adenylyltransferase
LKIHYDYHSYHVQKPVITTGAFDGVHKGHIEILNRLNAVADSLQGESVVVTFWPHPRLILKQNDNSNFHLLNTLDEKLSLLEKTGVQHVVVVPFTEEFSKLTSGDFVEKILVNQLNVKHYVIGFNHHFGKDREGNFDRMISFAEHMGFTLEKLEAQIIENEKVSSTLIRSNLTEGNVSVANKYLGYDYMLTGKILEGKRIGRTIGFPTANVKVNHDFKLIPKVGVYAVEVELEGGIRCPGMLNIGYRPTVTTSPDTLSIEVHIIGFSGDIYHQNLTLYFKHRIRDEVKFAGLDLLKQQLNNDKSEVIKLLGA